VTILSNGESVKRGLQTHFFAVPVLFQIGFSVLTTLSSSPAARLMWKAPKQRTPRQAKGALKGKNLKD